jgi:hypothetical protein
MAVRLSVLFAGRPLPPEDYWYSFLLEVELTPGPCAAGSIRPIEKSRNGTRDLPTCSIVPQPITQPRTLLVFKVNSFKLCTSSETKAVIEFKGSLDRLAVTGSFS